MNMTSTSFRLAHLLRAIDDCGTIEALSKRVELSPQYLSQLKNGTRGIGHKTARKIEAGMKWPPGIMDRPPEGIDLDQELTYLLNTLPEQQSIQAIVSSMPRLSESGIKTLTAALLAVLSASEKSE